MKLLRGGSESAFKNMTTVLIISNRPTSEAVSHGDRARQPEVSLERMMSSLRNDIIHSELQAGEQNNVSHEKISKSDLADIRLRHRSRRGSAL